MNALGRTAPQMPQPVAQAPRIASPCRSSGPFTVPLSNYGVSLYVSVTEPDIRRAGTPSPPRAGCKRLGCYWTSASWTEVQRRWPLHDPRDFLKRLNAQLTEGGRPEKNAPRLDQRRYSGTPLLGSLAAHRHTRGSKLNRSSICAAL
jgi:hypothetical protein